MAAISFVMLVKALLPLLTPKEELMTLWTLLLGGLGVVAISAAGTMLLPRHIHIERQSTLATTPDAILALATSTQGYQAFNPYKSVDPNLSITPFGPTNGIGAGFHFDGKDGKGSQTISEIGPSHVRYDIDLGAMGQPVQSIHAIPTNDGTRVTWRMDMDLGFNPVARVFGLFLDKMLGQTFDQGLANLAAAT